MVCPPFVSSIRASLHMSVVLKKKGSIVIQIKISSLLKFGMTPLFSKFGTGYENGLQIWSYFLLITHKKKKKM